MSTEATDRKIEDATPDTDVTGVEKVPVSDNQVAKCVTIEQIKDFALAKIGALSQSSATGITNPNVYVQDGTSLKSISKDDFAQLVADYMMGKANDTLVDSVKFSVVTPNGQKTTTLAAVVAYVSGQINTSAIDIAGKTVAPNALADSHLFAVAQLVNNVWTTFKGTLFALKQYVIDGLPGQLSESSSALGSSDKLLFVDNTSGNLMKVAKSAAGLGTGNVIGPSTNTNNAFAIFNGTNSKTIKSGPTLTQTVSSSSQSSQVPSASSVNDAISLATSRIVRGPYDPETGSATTENNIPQWDATTRTLKDGLQKTTTISSASDASDSKIPTEKAVATAIDGSFPNIVSGPSDPETGSATTENNIPQWDATARKLKDGLGLVTEFTEEPSDTNVPSESLLNNVYTSLEGKIVHTDSTNSSLDVYLNSIRSNKQFGYTVFVRYSTDGGTTHSYALCIYVSGSIWKKITTFD